MNQRHNPNRTRNIIIGVVCGFIMLLLLIGCIAVTVKICQYAGEGKLDAWLEEDSEYDNDYESGRRDDDEDFWDEEEKDSDDRYDYDDEYDYYEEYDYYDYDDEYDGDEPFITYDDLNEGPSIGEYYSYDTDNRVEDLSYQVEMCSDVYLDEGESDYSYYSTYIQYFYPVVTGDVPNVDIINETIADEWRCFIDFYEDDFKPYMSDDDDGIYAELKGRVAYMSEDILSVVYEEYIQYGTGYQVYYVYSLNFDMETGVLLDNVEILELDEEFAGMFREKSEKQNGSFSDLDDMTDKEISEEMNSYSLILFYVPQGMEVGLNTENGWVSVTLDDYQKYLKSA